MSRSTVPVYIRPHLVPFFFEEFEGIEAVYLNKKVKAAKISTRKPIGTIIRLLVEKTEKPQDSPAEKYMMYLSISDRQRSRFFGQVYKCASGQNSFLKLPKAGVELLNDHLESIFRNSLVNFVDGHITENETGQIKKAVDLFLIKYDLYERGYEIESLRRYYYRVIKEGYRLKKMQHECPVKFKKSDRPEPILPPVTRCTSRQMSLF